MEEVTKKAFYLGNLDSLIWRLSITPNPVFDSKIRCILFSSVTIFTNLLKSDNPHKEIEERRVVQMKIINYLGAHDLISWSNRDLESYNSFINWVHLEDLKYIIEKTKDFKTKNHWLSEVCNGANGSRLEIFGYLLEEHRKNGSYHSVFEYFSLENLSIRFLK